MVYFSSISLFFVGAVKLTTISQKPNSLRIQQFDHVLPANPQSGRFYKISVASKCPTSYRQKSCINMGKGGGCLPSKHKQSAAASNQNAPLSTSKRSFSFQSRQRPSSIEADSVENGIPQRKVRILIVFYSMYGHIEALAREIKKGVDGVEGVEGLLFRVPETLAPHVLEQMQMPPKNDEIPVISAEELVEADGLLFGFPARYGCMAAQMKAFFDSTEALWREQKLAGVPAGFFVGTGTQGGGQETTAWTAITQLAHHGMVYVPIGYTFGDGMWESDRIRGGSPYGAGVVSGDGTREPSQTELALALAQHHGTYMASIVNRFAIPNRLVNT